MINQLRYFISGLYPFRAGHRATHQSMLSARQCSVDWVLPRQVAVGALPRASDVEPFKQAGIKAILTLCSEAEGAWPIEVQQAFACRRIVIPDSHYATQLMPHQVAIAVDHIHHCIESGRPVFVHCLAGVERSPTICTAYLCRYHHYSLWESLNWIQHIHPESLPSEHQIQTIREYLNGCEQKTA